MNVSRNVLSSSKARPAHKEGDECAQHPPDVALALRFPVIAIKAGPVRVQEPLLDSLGKDGGVRDVKRGEDNGREREGPQDRLEAGRVGVDVCEGGKRGRQHIVPHDTKV